MPRGEDMNIARLRRVELILAGGEEGLGEL
jgi:hypothetical protein